MAKTYEKAIYKNSMYCVRVGQGDWHYAMKWLEQKQFVLPEIWMEDWQMIKKKL